MVVFLFVANAVTIASFWLTKKDHQPIDGGGPARFVIATLGFDQNQQDEYLALAHEHQSQIRPIRDDIKQAKDDLYTLLSQPNVSDSTKAAAIRAISVQTEKIDLITFDHFAKVRQLCTEQQRKKFDEIIKKVIQMMGMPHQGGPPPEPPPHHGPPL